MAGGDLNEKAAKNLITHQKTNTRLYGIWAAMISCCENVKNNRYDVYGKRGILICKEWRNDFTNFYNWSMENGYSDELTIDRIDVNGNYEPSNCRWVGRIEQMNNTTRNRNIEYRGQVKTLKQWSNIFGFNYKYFHEIMSKNEWNIEKVLNIPYFKERLNEVKSV